MIFYYFLLLGLGLCLAVRIDDTETQLKTLRERVSILERNAMDFNHRNSILEQAISTPKRSSLEKAAFTAQLTSNVSYADGENVVFDEVVLDNLGNYNPNIGYFACPNDGAYLFSVTIHSPPSKKAQVSLRQSNNTGSSLKKLVRTYMYDAADFSGSHSHTIILAATEGDLISVVSDGSGSTDGITQIVGGGSYSIFMGYEI